MHRVFKMSSMRTWLLMAFLALGFQLPIDGFDRSPFYTRSLELFPSAGYRYQFYQNIKSDGKSIPYHGRNSYFDLNLKGAYQPYALEVEATMAASNCFYFHLDHLSALGKWQLFNEDVGDPWSFCVGADLTWVPNIALIDPSVFHRGFVELELFVAAGRSIFDCLDEWSSRYWGSLGCGLSDRGSPWLDMELHYERRLSEKRQIDFELKGLYGFGGDKFPHVKQIGHCHLAKNSKHGHPFHGHSFKGYGPIAYRYLGGKISLSHQFDFDGILYLHYALGLYSHNAPSYPQEVGVKFIYPFGL